jgi:MFS family permease
MKNAPKQDICPDGQMLPKSEWRVDYTDGETFENWITDLDLYCETDFAIGAFGSAFFVGFALSGILLKMSDYIGRKKVISIGLIMQIMCCYGIYFFHNKYLYYLLIVIAGISYGKNICVYVIITEIVPRKHKMTIGVC